MNVNSMLVRRGPFGPNADLFEARKAYAEFRHARGMPQKAPRLLTWPEENVKLNKSGVPTIGLSLAPSTVSGHNVCNRSTPNCRADCVAFSGKGGLVKVMDGRIVKTEFLAAEPEFFIAMLHHELWLAVERYGSCMARLNTFSDLVWETIAPTLFEENPRINFYDYTKWAPEDRDPPDSYRLVYSVSEKTPDELVIERARQGHSQAVVFDTARSKPLPESWLGIPVIDGDATDDRWSTPPGVIVGLRAKGTMRISGAKMVKKAA